MTSFTDVFGGTNISPSDVSYSSLALTEDTALAWSLEANTDAPVVAKIMDVVPTAAYAITLPDATQVSTGTTVLLNNVGSYTVTVKGNSGSTLASLGAGEVWQLYLTNNSTAGGTWRVFRFGAATASAQASALAGAGLVAEGAFLAQASDVTAFNTNYTAGAADRASTYVWTGGVGTLSLPAAATVGDNWFMSVRNGGTGNLTVAPAGADPINTDTSLVMLPADSMTLVTDGLSWWTVGLGQSAVFAFDYTVINLTGQATPYTLSGAELNRIAYQFTGVLTENVEVIVPKTTQQYWFSNETTGGTYTLSLRTSTQTPALALARGARGIYYCNGTDLVKADTQGISTPVAVNEGGTGSTTAGGALINLGGTSVGIAVFTAASQAAAQAAIGTVAVAYGGTSFSSYTTGDLLYASGSGALSKLGIGSTGQGLRVVAGVPAWTADSSYAVTTFSGGTTGLLPSSPTAGVITLSGTLVVANGGTGVATLTGMVKGNGTSAMSAGTPGTDYVAPATATSFTAMQSFGGSSSVLGALFTSAAEVWTVSATAATGTITYDTSVQGVLYYTSNAAANWTVNFRHSSGTTLNTALSTNQSVTVVHIVTQGGTAYYNNVIQVDGTSVGVTTKWLTAIPTSGNINAIDIYRYVILKTGAATFTVIASQTKAL